MRKILIFLLFFSFTSGLNADTLHLKNGRTIEGLVKTEDENRLTLEVCSGAVTFDKSEIEEIEKSTPEQASAMRLKWEVQKQENQKKWTAQQIEEEAAPKKIEFSQDTQNIMLPVLLNNKVEAKLVLDTGASTVMLRKDIAKKLGIDTGTDLEPYAKVSLADGKQVNVKLVILKSVKVQGVEANDVEAVILSEEGNIGFGDGLLGMSFLKKFNFKIDQKNKKLILEKF
jgi:clan AA aspartic protease (TIGR02281 family)